MSKKYTSPNGKSYKDILESGFSLVEIVVAMAIMSVVAGLFATSVVQLQKTQGSFEDKNASFSFMSGLTAAILGDQQSCTSLLQGTRLRNQATEFTINNFSGLGSQSVDLKQNTTIVAGDASHPKVRLRNLTIHAKPNVDTTRINAGGVDYERKVAVITVTTERRQPGGGNSGQTIYQAEPPRTLEVPVYVRSNVIESCQVNMNRVDVCNTIGAGIDPANTSRCLPVEQCFVKGSFFTSVCSPPYAGCMPSSVNPITGASTCPANSTRTSTGMYQQTYEVSCGKKCSYNVTNTLEFFMCMQCD